MFISKQTLTSTLLCLFVFGCSSAPSTKPLDKQASVAKLSAKHPTSTDFNHFLTQYGYAAENLPLTVWGIDELTLCALFYHTKLDIAKQQLALSQLAVQTAGIRPTPTINGEISHSNQKNEDLKPWAYGLSIDIPVATNNKRGFRIEKAEQQLEVARMNVAETAWQLRNQIAIDLIAYHQNLVEINLLEQELSTQNSMGNMLEKRVNAGVASKSELSAINLLALKVKHQLNSKRAQSTIIKAALAADVGLTPEKFNALPIKPLAIEETLSQQASLLETQMASQSLQQDALLNRIDIRRSIAQYAAAESEIRLQAAQQIPDITINPGILFEFGDKIWSLGFSSLLSLLHKNTALLEEAKQLREIEGAQFEHLQATVIAQINQLQTHYQTAKKRVEQAKGELNAQSLQELKMQKQFEAGLIGKFDFTRHTLNTLVAKQQLLATQFTLLQIAAQIEDAMQKPLYSPFSMPTSTTTRLSNDS
jgi:outer membrane protein, heavy metal efflux system